MFWLTTLNPTFNKGTLKKMSKFGLGGGGMGGEDDVEKVGRTSGKNPGYASTKARKNNRSLERPYHLFGVALSRKH